MTVFAVWPGLGKTTTSRRRGELDLESSGYRWKDAAPDRDVEASKCLLKQQDERWPLNYIDAIRQAALHGDVYISLHPEVLDALEGEGVNVVAVIPSRGRKDALLQSYRDRGNTEAMASHMERMWDVYYDQVKGRSSVVTIDDGDYLCDLLDKESM